VSEWRRCYYSRFLLVHGLYACAQLILQLGVGVSDVFVVGGCSGLHVHLGVGADAGGAETDLALCCVWVEVRWEQKLEMSYLGCRSQKVVVKSIIVRNRILYIL
jgi:hypothetical protein